MNQKSIEHIALYSLVLVGTLVVGVLARQFVLSKGVDDFSSSVAFFATVIVLMAIYVSLQTTFNQFLLPRIEAFLLSFSAFQTMKNHNDTVSVPGNTEKAAQQVASIVSGDLHKIQPEKSYTSADLNWRDKSSRSSVEMDDPTSRPAFIDDLKNLAEYDTVYLGFPIWWNQAPRLINTFLEKYDLSGKTVIPFATSGSSNISNAESELRKAYPDVNWQKGKLMNGATEEDIKNWTKK